MFDKGGFVYIMANFRNGTLYVGVTSDLIVRIKQHKTNFHPDSFSAKYSCHLLVYYQLFSTIESAIEEEKRIKGGSRKAKLKLIEKNNPNWEDLFETIETF